MILRAYSFDDFDIVERLGKKARGSDYFGIRAAVFHARRENKNYALKIMTYNRSDLYEQEYGTLMKLESHPNIIKIYGVIKIDKFSNDVEKQLKGLNDEEISQLKDPPYILCIIMDLYQHNLNEFVDLMPRPLAESIAIQILIQIFNGLKHLYNNNIVHRDLKPDNILISYDTIEGNIIKGLKVVLTDFGTHLTKLLLDTSKEEDKKLLKIPKGAEYLRAPEAWPPKSKNKPAIIYYNKSDIWAIGRICYQLFNVSDADVLPKNFSRNVPTAEDLPYLEASYSEAFKSIIRSMLIPDPKDRPTVDEILDKLKALESSVVK